GGEVRGLVAKVKERQRHACDRMQHQRQCQPRDLDSTKFQHGYDGKAGARPACRSPRSILPARGFEIKADYSLGLSLCGVIGRLAASALFFSSARRICRLASSWLVLAGKIPGFFISFHSQPMGVESSRAASFSQGVSGLSSMTRFRYVAASRSSFFTACPALFVFDGSIRHSLLSFRWKVFGVDFISASMAL